MKSDSESPPAPGAAAAKVTAKASGRADTSVVSINSPILKDVRVPLDAKLGQATMSVQELLALKSGSIVKLEAKINGLIELRLNGSMVARGEIVAVDDNFGIRIVEIAELA